jgi:peptidoglycan/xylan/chitin deacetylase (PgdA/CDA1 family)
MNLKRFLVAAPIVATLIFAGFADVPGPPPGTVVQVAGVSALVPTEVVTPSPAPTSTPQPTPTAAPTKTPTFAPTPTRTLTPTRNPNLRVARVPILMYHYLGIPPPDADKYRLDLTVTPANFDAQMEYLAIEGYHPIRLSDLTEHLLNGKPLPSKPIVLTFDDGYADNFENAFPILKNYKFPATFFLITQLIDEKRPGYMTWDQAEEMAIEGMEIGAHTVNHIELRGRSLAVQNSEIAGAKAMIEARIGTPVTSFCYPSGKYDARTLEVLRSTGYLAAVTEIAGARQATEDIFELRRIRVRGSYSVDEFAYWLKYWMASGK